MSTMTNRAKTAKPIGSPEARRQVSRITHNILAYTDKAPTLMAGATKMGLGVDDISNMRAWRSSRGKSGARFSVAMLFKMVVTGKYDPVAILDAMPLRKHRRRNMMLTSRHHLDDRIRALAWDYPGEDLAKLTGLSVTGAYGLRYAKRAHVTMYTVLGFIAAGHTVEELVFGKAP